MDNANVSDSQESETLPEMEQKNGVNVSTNSADPPSECTSNLEENATKMGDFEADKSPSKASEVATDMESISEAVSSDLTDENTQIGAQLRNTPVSGEHSENTSVERILENKDTAEKVNKTQTSESDSTEILDASKNNTNVIHKNDHVEEDTINNQNNQDIYTDNNNSPHYIKWIVWKGVKTAIVTQNDNGPCPLLAIINILLLRRTIEFPRMQEMVTTQQLMDYLGDVVLKEIPQV